MRKLHLAGCWFVLVGSLFLSSCALQPVMRFEPQGCIPSCYSMFTSEDLIVDRWWESFGDSELIGLVEEGLSDSFSIRGAWARLEQARAEAVKRGALRFPDLNLTGEASTSRQRIGAGIVTSENFALGLLSNYEVDLWGRVRSSYEAATLEAVASIDDLNTAAITLAAEITIRWISIVSRRMQKQLLYEQLETNRTFLGLVELRFKKAVSPALDVFQQAQTVAQVEAAIPLVESQEELLTNELAVLLGKPPREPLNITRRELVELGAPPETGIPADLLANRPDVRAAGLRLKSADWEVVVARADRLPAIRLTAAGSYTDGHLNQVFDNWVGNLAANLTGPVFDADRRKAEVERTLAVADQRLAAYQSTVYNAIKDVEDALVQEQKQREHIAKLQEQLDLARKALEEAGRRYAKGLSDYLPVLSELLAVQRLERDIVQRRTELLIFRINLYRALGGCWPDELKKKEQ